MHCQCGPQHFNIDNSPVDQQNAHEASVPEARERVDCGVQTEVTLSLNAMCVEWTPTISNAGVSENIIDGVDAKMELAMLAQRLDVLPPAVAPEGEIDSDDDDESVIGMADEVDDVGESDEAVDTEEVDITSGAALVQKIELSEQAVVAPPEPHVESRSKRAISEVASGFV